MSSFSCIKDFCWEDRNFCQAAEGIKLGTGKVGTPTGWCLLVDNDLLRLGEEEDLEEEDLEEEDLEEEDLEEDDKACWRNSSLG
jgi:hypothetical protein